MNIIEFLKEQNKSIAVVESCTGGLLNYQLSKISGASLVYRGGLISYQNMIKTKILGIDSKILDKYSPYSFEVLEGMLDGIIKLMDCDFAIATSGVAGPNGGDSKNPVGSVYIGIKQKGQASITTKQIFSGDRESIQLQASTFALDFFARHFISK